VCRYTTLWYVSVLRKNNNKTTSATTHFKKLTAETTCLLSQLLSKKSPLSFSIKCLMCLLCCWTTHPRLRHHWLMARLTKRCGSCHTRWQLLASAGWLSWIVNIDRPSSEEHPEQHNFSPGCLGATCQARSRNWSVALPAWVRLLTFHKVVQPHTWGVVGYNSFITNGLLIIAMKKLKVG